MKLTHYLPLALVLLGLATVGIIAEDIAARAIRYRNGTTLSMDRTTSISDEDAAWKITNPQLSLLASVSGNGKALTIRSNALSSWPTAPTTAGDAVIVNSNGYLYALCSGTGATWSKTNSVATP